MDISLVLMIIIAWIVSRSYQPSTIYVYRLFNQNSRPFIPQSIRREVFERCNYICQHCGGRESLVIDHITPWSWTKDNSINNLQILCCDCNIKKGNKFVG